MLGESVAERQAGDVAGGEPRQVRFRVVVDDLDQMGAAHPPRGRYLAGEASAELLAPGVLGANALEGDEG